MRVQDAAKKLGVSKRHVFRLIEQGKLSAEKRMEEVKVKPTFKEVVVVDEASIEQYRKQSRNRKKDRRLQNIEETNEQRRS
jgi:excisionase family DNA binding protein